MSRSRIVRATCGVIIGSFLLQASPARASDVEACLSAADQAQQLRDEGKFREAREQMATCARDVCPGPVKRDCGDWLSQLDATAPSVVLSARDGSTDLTDVSVSMDGAPLASKLDGRPILVNLGTHAFTFEYQGASQTQNVVISAGQRMRPIAVQFGSSVGEGDGNGGGGTAETSSKRSIVPFIVGGAGLVALGSFAFFGLSGNSQFDELKATCAPNCTDDQVSPVHTKYLVADISLGVGIVALGVATYLFLTDSPHAAKAPAETPSEAKVRFNFGPTAGGAAGGISGTF